MYRIIFPDEKVPSPCMPAPLSPYTMCRTNNASDFKPDNSRFQSMDECKNFLHAELPRLVRPAIEEYVASLFEEVQKKVNRNTVEILRDVETKVLQTFHFQEDQSSLSALATMSPGHGVAAIAVAEPSPLLSPCLEMSKVSALLEEMKDDRFSNELFANTRFDLDGFLEASHQGLSGLVGCENFSMDSAYF